jgi:RNA polymerase sigma factor (sigma-70 family)
VSLDRPVGTDGDAELSDFVEDDAAADPFTAALEVSARQSLEQAMRLLDEREQEVVRLRYGLEGGTPRTLSDVGKHFDLTRERIRQIEARAMSKLRHPSADTGARDLLAV